MDSTRRAAGFGACDRVWCILGNAPQLGVEFNARILESIVKDIKSALG